MEGRTPAGGPELSDSPEFAGEEALGLEPEGPGLQAQLAAQHALARRLMGADDLADVGPSFLAIISELLGWELGALWAAPDGSGPLNLVATWDPGDLGAGDFWSSTRELRVTRGVGVPGQAWETGELTWASDLAQEANLPRRDAALRAGLEGAFAIPVPVGPPERVVAVVEFFGRSFTAPSDAVVALLVGFTDQLAMFISRRRSEQSLRRSENLKSAILASSLDAVIGMNESGEVIEWSASAAELLGFSREEALGRELAALVIPPELRDAHREGLARCIAGGEAPLLDKRTELVALDRQGTRIPVELTITRIPDSSPPKFTGALRDIRGRTEAERTRDHLAAIAESSQDAVMAKDLEGYVTAWNRGAEQTYGYSAEEAMGQHVSFIVPPDHAGEEMDILARIRRGERVETYETERIRKDGIRVKVALTVSPIRQPVLGITGASIVARDITAEWHRRNAAEFLARLTSAFDASLGPEETAKAIVEAAIPGLAEVCVIDLVQPDGTIGGGTVAAREPSLARELEAIRRRSPLSPEGAHPVARVLRDGEPAVVRDLTSPGTRAEVAQSDEHAHFIAKVGYRSAAVLPMVARGRTLGVLSFLHAHGDLRYDPEDLALLSDLASRAALALDNARLSSERAAIAKTLQAGLRPDEPPEIPGYEVAVVFEPAGENVEIGGDFYDVFQAGDGWFVLIGDVSGKGTGAAILTSQIRHTVRALARRGGATSEVIQTLNDLLLEESTAGRFVTLQLVAIRAGGSSLELVSAGHPPAMHVATDDVRQIWGGSLLGAFEGSTIAGHEVDLGPGETLLLYTDGLLEAGPLSRHRSPDNLAAELSRQGELDPEDLVEMLRADAFGRADGEIDDDLVILALRRGTGGGER